MWRPLVFGGLCFVMSCASTSSKDEGEVVASHALAETTGRVHGLEDDPAQGDEHRGHGADAVGDGVAGPYDWDVRTGAAVTAAPAFHAASFTSTSPTDAVYFGTTDDNGNSGIAEPSGRADVANYLPAMAHANFFKLSNLYAGAPSVEWYARIPGGLQAAGVITSRNANRIYALGATGALHCFPATLAGAVPPYAMPDDALCPGWTARAVTPAGAAASSTPWIDFGYEYIYFGDLRGNLVKVDARSGALVWKVNLGAPIHASPIVVDRVVYVGDDAGRFHRVFDPGATPPVRDDRVRLCASCRTPSPIYAGATLDVWSKTLYVVADGQVYEFAHDPAGATAWAQTPQSPKRLGPAGILMAASPALDWVDGTLQIAFANSVYQVTYPFKGGPTDGVGATALVGQSSDPSYPRSSPYYFFGAVYVGDGAGRVEKLTASASTASPALAGVTDAYGVRVDSTPLVDYAGGNAHFGYTSKHGGGFVQRSINVAWSTPAAARATHGHRGGDCDDDDRDDDDDRGGRWEGERQGD